MALTSLQVLSAGEIEKGKAIYLANCIACHNRDPNKKGGLGPELVGTPLEVMLVKIVEGNRYPEGYKPKRPTKMMRKFPQLKKDIPAIYAYINSLNKELKTSEPKSDQQKL